MEPALRDLYLAYAAQLEPDRAAADAALAKFLKDQPTKGDQEPYDIAWLYAANGDAGKTVQWLERASAQSHFNTLFVLTDLLILRFRDDPRFIALCRRLGLPPHSESDALSVDQIRAQLAAKR